MEHGHVLGDRDLMRGIVESLEVHVERAPVVVAQLGQRDGEAGAQLDQRQHAPLKRGDALAGRRRHLGAAPEIGGRVLPAARAGEVDELRARPAPP